MDGAGRHFAPVAIIILTAFVMPIRPKDGTIYDGTAALNNLASGDYWQYRYIEIFSLEEQSKGSKLLADFIRSQVGKNPGLIAVSSHEIREGRCEDGKVIADSASYLFSDQRFGVEPPPYRLS
jgi:hypothetical protein